MSVPMPGLPVAQGAEGGGGDALAHMLGRVRLRIRTLLMVRYSSLALLVSVSLAIVWMLLIVVRLLPHLTNPPLAMLILIGASVLLGLALAWVPRLTDLDIARLTERRADLKERLSSALEFREATLRATNPSGPFYDIQWQDANQHAGGVDVKSLYPITVPRTFLIGMALLLALFGTFFLPTLPAFWSPQQKRDAEDVKVAAIAIQKVAEDKEKAADQQNLDETKKAARETKALANQMKLGKVPKKESMVALQKLTQKFEQEHKKLEDQMPKKQMDEAAKQFKKAMDAMQKELEQSEQKKRDADSPNGTHPNAKDAKKPLDKQSAEEQKKQAEAQKQQQNMQKMMDQLKKMQQAMQQGDSPEMRQQMQQALQQLAQQMQQNGAQMSQAQMQTMQQAMQQLAQSLQGTQMQQMAQEMQQLAQQMQQMQQMQLSQEQMEQLAKALQKCAGMCKGSGKGKGMGAAMDAKQLAELIAALKEGRLTMGGQGNGFGGRGPGRGIGGQGHPTDAMKDPGATNPRLVVGNKSSMSKALGKAGDAKEFYKYLSMSSQPSKHSPNGMVGGARTAQGDELQIDFKGDPEAAQSSAPYYKAVETTKRQAESTLDKENIPAAYKKQVRDYFDSVH